MSEPIVQTTQGAVRGVEKLGCVQFRAIPFAAPPTGERRWRSPEPHDNWEGVRDAREFGPICPQAAGGMERLAGQRQALPMDEDCLTLNVYTPAPDDAGRPVMVWIHGGGFTTGAGRTPWYSGHTFARDGVVVVTINYRLNAFGFLHLEELFGDEFRDSGTLGIQDQVAALHWVRKNIANFGGDPGNVTIFGESAGGMSVGTLLATPSAVGLFHKAIPQSGAAHSYHSSEIAGRIAARFCADVGIAPGDAAALRTLPVEKILESVSGFGQILGADAKELFGSDFTGFGLPFQPVFGGDILPRRPIDAVRDGSASGIPVLAGTTLEEWKLFTLLAGPDSLRAEAPRPLRNLFDNAGKSVDDLVAAYKERLGSPSEVELRNAIETDRNFRIPAIRLAEAQVDNGAPAWMYRFDWRSPAFGGRLGACHALEIPFVFDNLDAPGADAFTGNAGPATLATAIHRAWVAFAKTGDPSTDELAWPRYDTARRATMLFDEDSRVEDDPDGGARQLWDDVL